MGIFTDMANMRTTLMAAALDEVRNGGWALYVSLEMNIPHIYKRFRQVAYDSLHDENLKTPEGFIKFVNDSNGELELAVFPTFTLSVDDLLGQVLQNNPATLVCIDSLPLLKSDATVDTGPDSLYWVRLWGKLKAYALKHHVRIVTFKDLVPYDSGSVIPPTSVTDSILGGMPTGSFIKKQSTWDGAAAYAKAALDTYTGCHVEITQIDEPIYKYAVTVFKKEK